MIEKEKIFGLYTATEKDESEFSNNFELKIFQQNEDIKFEFIMKTLGNFGVVGKSWFGKGIFRSDHLALIIEKECDWTFIKEDDETIEYTRDKNQILPIEIYTDEARVIVYHIDIDRYILLNKVKKENEEMKK
ncbi:MAG: hypothetical protein JXL97_10190 [Bacteroidales bacterium]|nr:hypothetical protein [Bacteroidales bacterium]